MEEEKQTTAPQLKTTDVKDTVLLQVPDASMAFRVLKEDFERLETITCPANSMTYKKEDLKVIDEGRGE